MAFTPPSFVRPNEPLNLRGLDGLFEAYDRERAFQLQRQAQEANLARQRGTDMLTYGFDPAQATPQNLAAAQRPAPEGPTVPGQAPLEDPQVAAMRSFIENRKRGQQAELSGRLKEAEKSDIELQKSKIELDRLRQGGGQAPLDLKDRAAIESRLYDDFASSQVVKEFNSVKSATQNILSLASKQGGIRDLSQLYSFIKVLDPGSVVREGEISLSRQGEPALERLALLYKQANTGQITSEQLSNQIREAAVTIYKDREAGVESLRNTISQRAQQYPGLNPSFVAPDIRLPAQSLQTNRESPESIRAEFKAGRISREEAKRRISALGGVSSGR